MISLGLLLDREAAIFACLVVSEGPASEGIMIVGATIVDITSGSKSCLMNRSSACDGFPPRIPPYKPSIF